jgi:hypothetical protein
LNIVFSGLPYAVHRVVADRRVFSALAVEVLQLDVIADLALVAGRLTGIWSLCHCRCRFGRRRLRDVEHSVETIVASMIKRMPIVFCQLVSGAELSKNDAAFELAPVQI